MSSDGLVRIVGGALSRVSEGAYRIASGVADRLENSRFSSYGAVGFGVSGLGTLLGREELVLMGGAIATNERGSLASDAFAFGRMAYEGMRPFFNRRNVHYATAETGAIVGSYGAAAGTMVALRMAEFGDLGIAAGASGVKGIAFLGANMLLYDAIGRSGYRAVEDGELSTLRKSNVLTCAVDSLLGVGGHVSLVKLGLPHGIAMGITYPIAGVLSTVFRQAMNIRYGLVSVNPERRVA